MINVTNKLKVYEVDRKESQINGPEITVSSHWNRQEFVNLTINDKTYTILAKDLEAALKNSTNIAKY